MTYTIEQIEELLDKTTPGPWYATVEFEDLQLEDSQKQIWTVGNKPSQLNWENDSDQNGYGMLKADAQLAAASREIIPQLLAELKAEREKNEIAVEYLKIYAVQW